MAGKRPKKKTTTHSTGYAALALLGAILVLLIVILTRFPEDTAPVSAEMNRNDYQDEQARRIDDSAGDPGEVDSPPVGESGGADAGVDSGRVLPVEEEAPGSVDEVAIAPMPRIAEPVGGRVYLVIDDAGYSMKMLEPFLLFPGRMTIAVIPGLQFSREAAERTLGADKEVMLHQPMEAVGGQDPGTGAIFVGMGPEEIAEIIEENLHSVPGATAMNNHMGSRVTADRESMAAVMRYLSGTGLVFLDSVTTELTVAAEAAAARGVPYLFRNSVFLDNEETKESITAALSKGLRTASRTGQAVLIGHVQSPALAEVLEEAYPDMLDRGFTFHGISEYVYK